MRNNKLNDLTFPGFRLVPFFWTIICVFFCGHLEAQQDREIDEVYIRFSQAYAELDPSIVREIYHPDAIYMSPDDAVKEGIQHIIPGFAQMFGNAKKEGSELKIEFSILKRKKMPDLVYDVGYYRLSRIKDGKLMGPWVGKFTTILEKNDEGRWQFVLDGYSSAPVEAFETAKIINP